MKIFIVTYPIYQWSGTQWYGLAVSNDGEIVHKHTSSTEDFSFRDTNRGVLRKYPDAEVECVPRNKMKTHKGWLDALSAHRMLACPCSNGGGI